MKNHITILIIALSLLRISASAQNHQEIESPTEDVLSLNSTGSTTTKLNFINTNALGTGSIDVFKRAYISTNSNVLNIGLSDNNTSGRIEFFGQNLRRMTMNADGKFGIGNIIPTEQLDVDGKVKIRDLPAGADTDSYVTADASGNLRTKSSSSPTYAIGDFAQGGVVFWVSPSGEHGKVVSIYNATDIEWSNIENARIGRSAQSDINGAGNTIAIILQDGHKYSAAMHCERLAYGGYDDWYLPSKNELNEVFLRRADINPTAVLNGGENFEAAFYWNSLEADFNYAWIQDFSNGNHLTNFKSNDNGWVRAIRAF